MPSIKVLLADDHVVVRAGLRNALDVLPNFEIAGEVGNGRELNEALSRTNPDLLVLDANMAAQRVLNGERWISGSLVGRLTQQRSAPSSNTLPWLTRRQRELLRLLTQGMDNRNIAQTLDLSVKTVENHLTALYRVLGVDSRLKAMHYTLRHPELLAMSGQETLELEPRQQKGNYDLTVLVVDDNIRYRQQLTRLIGKIRPTSVLYEAENISEAVNLGQQIHPQLAIIDVVLENEDGIQCARQLRNISPSTRIVVVSAYPDRGFRKQALSAGAVAFVDKKDLDTASLRQVIEDALR
jgi:DNA-binding NarL/FixJ family response regulator